MAQLQQEMTRYHEDTRPRVNNPTFASTNVGTSLGMNSQLIYRSLSHRYSLSQLKPSSREIERTVQELPRIKRSVSQLSGVGMNSLKSLNKYISDKDVYDKQQKNYNIINSQPKQYQDTIQVYPKYRLQNQDQNYFKKMQIQRELTDKLNTNRKILGLDSVSNPQQFGKFKIRRGKYLNNVDEVKDII